LLAGFTNPNNPFPLSPGVPKRRGRPGGNLIKDI